MHVITIEFEIPIYSSQLPQLALLQWDKTLIKIPDKYKDYADVFLFKLAMELPKNNGINEHIIELIEGKQPLYGSIYVFSPIELEILKTYIKTYLKT